MCDDSFSSRLQNYDTNIKFFDYSCKSHVMKDIKIKFFAHK